VHVLVDIAVACGVLVAPLAVTDRALAIRSRRSNVVKAQSDEETSLAHDGERELCTLSGRR
jgi:hypothetical protein